MGINASDSFSKLNLKTTSLVLKRKTLLFIHIANLDLSIAITVLLNVETSVAYSNIGKHSPIVKGL